MDMFDGTFTFLLILLLVVIFGSRAETRISGTVAFKKFQWNVYLPVYVIMMAADWLQGPYVYRLYSFYGFSKAEIGQLFIAGFGSSMLMGTYVGSLADKFGRKKNCLVYGVIYTLSCMTKHSSNYWVLMVGRLLGGVATSILFSSFESWMLCEHHSRGFNEAWVSSTFSWSSTLNGVAAVISSLIAQSAVDHFNHPVVPFDLSIVLLVVGSILILLFWNENYGNEQGNVNTFLTDGLAAVRDDKKIFLIGAMQSCFEGAMYTFVFMWTPTLEQNNLPIPHGKILATFMLACSLGGQIFKYSVARYRVETIMLYVFGVSSVCNVVPVFTGNEFYNNVAFCGFEVCVGLFWSGMGTMRGKYIPESNRATIMNLFRIPLNLFVCTILLKVGSLSIGSVFFTCALAHFACFGMQTMLRGHDSHPNGEVTFGGH